MGVVLYKGVRFHYCITKEGDNAALGSLLAGLSKAHMLATSSVYQLMPCCDAYPRSAGDESLFYSSQLQCRTCEVQILLAMQ